MTLRIQGVSFSQFIDNTKDAFRKANISDVRRKNVIMRFLTAQLFPEGKPGENEHRLASLFEEEAVSATSSRHQVRREMNIDREQLMENEIRFEETLLLDLMVDGDNAPDNFKDAMSDYDDMHHILKAMGIALPKDEVESWCEGELASYLISDCEVGGFLVKAATPIPTSFSKKYNDPDTLDRHSYTFSWGFYHTRWFYHPSSMAALIEEVIHWRDAMLDEEFVSAVKKQAADK